MAPWRRPVRLPARGRLRSAEAARLSLAPWRHERLHDADGDALDDGGRRRRNAVSLQLPPRLLRRRAAEPRGDPLVPDQYGLTVLDYYGLTESYPLVANYPWLEVREGSMGRPMPGWDVR